MPALRGVHPAAEENVLAVARILRDEAEVLDAASTRCWVAATEVSLARLRALPDALRALVVQRLADDAAGGLAPGAAGRADEIAALRDHGRAAVDLPHGVRAVADGGVVRFERTPPMPGGRRATPRGRGATPYK